MRAAILIASLQIVCFLYLISGSAAQNACTTGNLTCAALNAPCPSTFDSTNNVYATTECPPSQWCSSGNCVDLGGVGATCSAGATTCAAGLGCVYSTTTVSPYYFYNCSSYAIVGNGDTCNTTSLCPNTHYCNGSASAPSSPSVCVPIVAVGSACNSSTQCGIGAYCINGTAGAVCTAAYSIAAGGNCNSTTISYISPLIPPSISYIYTIGACAAGLTCSIIGFPNPGVCYAPAASSGTACTGVTDKSCYANNETCVAACVNNNSSYSCTAQPSNTQPVITAAQNLWTCQGTNPTDVCSTTFGNITCPDCLTQACAANLYKVVDKCNVGVCPPPAPVTTASTTTATTASSTTSGSGTTATTNPTATTATTAPAATTTPGTTATTAPTATTATTAPTATTATTAPTATTTTKATTATTASGTTNPAATSSTTVAPATTSDSSVLAPLSLFVGVVALIVM